MPNSNLGPDYALAQRISNLEAQMKNLMTSPWLLNASTGQGGGQPGIRIDQQGVHAFNSAGTQITAMLTSDGSVTAFDGNGNAMARFGPLTGSAPGQYGVEVLVNGTWVQLGYQSTTWDSIAGKPASFPPSPHTHAGTDITSAVGDASGSSHAFNYNVGGSSFYAVWVGSDYQLGKNTSSARYKENVREHRVDPADVLNLTPVVYDRLGNPGVTEYGLIAEQVAEHFPELVQWFEGHIDNVRYDLLAVALLDVVKHQDERIKALEAAIPDHVPPAPPVKEHSRDCNNPPPSIPEPHPYTIQPQPNRSAP